MKKINGNVNLDTPNMIEMRLAVIEQELSSRSWKAYYEKMYFSLEAEKIEPEYREYQKRVKERMDKEKTQMEEFMATLQAGISQTDVPLEDVYEGPLPEEAPTPVIQMNQ